MPTLAPPTPRDARIRTLEERLDRARQTRESAADDERTIAQELAGARIEPDELRDVLVEAAQACDPGSVPRVLVQLHAYAAQALGLRCCDLPAVPR